MLAVTGPEGQTVDRCGRCDQRISQFHMMAFGILPQIFAGQYSDLGVNRNAMDRSEKCVQCAMFLWPGPMPKLGNGDRRAQQWSLRPTQLVPLNENSFIPGTS